LNSRISESYQSIVKELSINFSSRKSHTAANNKPERECQNSFNSSRDDEARYHPKENRDNIYSTGLASNITEVEYQSKMMPNNDSHLEIRNFSERTQCNYEHLLPKSGVSKGLSDLSNGPDCSTTPRSKRSELQMTISKPSRTIARAMSIAYSPLSDHRISSLNAIARRSTSCESSGTSRTLKRSLTIAQETPSSQTVLAKYNNRKHFVQFADYPEDVRQISLTSLLHDDDIKVSGKFVDIFSIAFSALPQSLLYNSFCSMPFNVEKIKKIVPKL